MINEGKLAVVLGIEVSELFDCRRATTAPRVRQRTQIDAQLDEVYELGVRDMELVNKFDNALAGVAGDDGTTGVVVNNGNKLETGHYWDMQTCTGPRRRATTTSSRRRRARTTATQLAGNVLERCCRPAATPVYGPRAALQHARPDRPRRATWSSG